MTKKTPDKTSAPLVVNTSNNPISFEVAMKELAELVAHMEEGKLALEDSVAAYARGSELVRYCTLQLEKVEQQVRVLDGELLKPFQSLAADENGDT